MNHPFGNALYHLATMIWGMLYSFTHMSLLSLFACIHGWLFLLLQQIQVCHVACDLNYRTPKKGNSSLPWIKYPVELDFQEPNHQLGTSIIVRPLIFICKA